MAIAGKVGAVYRQTTAAAVAFNDLPTTADATYTHYTINDATKRYWDMSQPVTVKKNGVVQTTGFTVQYCGGVVVFANALLNTDTVTVSGASFDVEPVGGMFGWKLDTDADTVEVTTYSSGGNKEYISALKGFNGSADAFWSNTDNTTFLTDGKPVILVLYVDSGAAKDRYEGYAILKKDSVSSAVKDVVKETIDFEGTGQVYYRAG